MRGAPLRRTRGTRDSSPRQSASRSAATWRSRSRARARASAHATPSPTMPATFSVPPRRRRSCGPPRTSAGSGMARAVDQEARALRPVQLVRRSREQVRAERDGIERELPDRLRGVQVERHAARVRELGELRRVLHDAGLVVGEDHAEQRGVVAQRGRDGLGVEPAVRVHRHARDGDALRLERAQRLLDGGVLDRGRHDVAPRARREHAAQRRVVRLGGARGEEHLARRGAEQLRDLLARALERRARRGALGVRAGRIAPALAQRRRHGVHDLRAHRRGGVVVQIDAHRRVGRGYEAGGGRSTAGPSASTRSRRLRPSAAAAVARSTSASTVRHGARHLGRRERGRRASRAARRAGPPRGSARAGALSWYAPRSARLRNSLTMPACASSSSTLRTVRSGTSSASESASAVQGGAPSRNARPHCTAIARPSASRAAGLGAALRTSRR